MKGRWPWRDDPPNAPSGTGKETEAQDAVTEEAVEAASTETEHPETDTAGETTAEAADAPGTSDKAPDSARDAVRGHVMARGQVWRRGKGRPRSRRRVPVSGEVEDTRRAEPTPWRTPEESANASSEGVASDDTGTAENGRNGKKPKTRTREETVEATVEETPEETPPPAEQAPPPARRPWWKNAARASSRLFSAVSSPPA